MLCLALRVFVLKPVNTYIPDVPHSSEAAESAQHDTDMLMPMMLLRVNLAYSLLTLYVHISSVISIVGVCYFALKTAVMTDSDQKRSCFSRITAKNRIYGPAYR